MGRLAVILGSNALGPGGGEIAAAAAEHGAAIVQRHGGAERRLRPPPPDRPRGQPALAGRAGCDRVLAIGSVGSLDAELAVGSFVCPDDFIALQLGLTIFDDARGHATPGFDPRWRARWSPPGAPAGGAAARRRRLLADDRAPLRDARPRSA